MIFKYAILLYGQFLTFMQPYVTLYDLVFISCFLYGGQPGRFLEKIQGSISLLQNLSKIIVYI